MWIATLPVEGFFLDLTLRSPEAEVGPSSPDKGTVTARVSLGLFLQVHPPKCLILCDPGCCSTYLCLLPWLPPSARSVSMGISYIQGCPGALYVWSQQTWKSCFKMVSGNPFSSILSLSQREQTPLQVFSLCHFDIFEVAVLKRCLLCDETLFHLFFDVSMIELRRSWPLF